MWRSIHAMKSKSSSSAIVLPNNYNTELEKWSIILAKEEAISFSFKQRFIKNDKWLKDYPKSSLDDGTKAIPIFNKTSQKKRKHSSASSSSKKDTQEQIKNEYLIYSV